MTTTLYVPGTSEKDPSKLIMSQQLVAGKTATNTDAIAAIQAAYVTSIAANHGAFTLNSTSGITNSTNDVILSQASSSQFGAVKVDNTTITAAAGVISVNPGAWTPYTPTVTAAAGTFTTVSATGRYQQFGKTIIFQNTILVTTVGTASGAIRSTLPFTAGSTSYAGGGVNSNSISLNWLIASGGTFLSINKYDASVVIGAGVTYNIGGCFETA